jgi:hypothetical protein
MSSGDGDGAGRRPVGPARSSYSRIELRAVLATAVVGAVSRIRRGSVGVSLPAPLRPGIGPWIAEAGSMRAGAPTRGAFLRLRVDIPTSRAGLHHD